MTIQIDCDVYTNIQTIIYVCQHNIKIIQHLPLITHLIKMLHTHTVN